MGYFLVSMLLNSIDTTSYAFNYHLLNTNWNTKRSKYPLVNQSTIKLHNKASFHCKLLSVNITLKWPFIFMKSLVHTGRRTTSIL